jgi:hypothetical protein
MVNYISATVCKNIIGNGGKAFKAYIQHSNGANENNDNILHFFYLEDEVQL